MINTAVVSVVVLMPLILLFDSDTVDTAAIDSAGTFIVLICSTVIGTTTVEDTIFLPPLLIQLRR